jgi:hypothetical protein
MSLAPIEKRQEIVEAATRPNGTVNVSKVYRLATTLWLEWLECRACGASAQDGCDCSNTRYYPRKAASLNGSREKRK